MFVVLLNFYCFPDSSVTIVRATPTDHQIDIRQRHGANKVLMSRENLRHSFPFCVGLGMEDVDLAALCPAPHRIIDRKYDGDPIIQLAVLHLLCLSVWVEDSNEVGVVTSWNAVDTTPDLILIGHCHMFYLDLSPAIPREEQLSDPCA